MDCFSLCVREDLKSYVYMLINPVKNTVFYIGKGQDNRAFQHSKAAIQETDEQSAKLDVIRRLLAEGTSPQIRIVRHGLTENEALLLESSLIDLLRFMEHEKLAPTMTNIASGHFSSLFGLRSPEEVEALYSAEKLETSEPCLLIKINRSKAERSLYDATRMAWKVSPDKAQKARYALAVFGGRVVEMFVINRWYPCMEVAPGRWAFEGEPVMDATLRSRHVGKVVQELFPKGAANPVRYLNVN